MKLRVTCPTFCHHNRCQNSAAAIPKPAVEVEMPAPAPHQGSIIAHIYDGRHSTVELLTEDAQNCEYFVPREHLASSAGSWQRCRPLMPVGGHAEVMAASYAQILRATDAVSANLAAFELQCGNERFLGSSHLTRDHSHSDNHLSESKGCPLHRISTYLSDRHGPSKPTRHGTHRN